MMASQRTGIGAARAKATLWRIVIPQQPTAFDEPTLQLGLVRHLQCDDLATTLMRVGDEQRVYIRVRGCDGCARGRCVIGCRVALLRRVLRAAIDQGVQLELVRANVRARPYSRTLIAWPAKDARPLDSALLAAWSEARLTVCLHSRTFGSGIVASAQLHVGAEGPPLIEELRAYGWRGWMLPRPVLRWEPLLPALARAGGRAWQGAPFLLLAPPRRTDTEAPKGVTLLP